ARLSRRIRPAAPRLSRHHPHPPGRAAHRRRPSAGRGLRRDRLQQPEPPHAPLQTAHRRHPGPIRAPVVRLTSESAAQPAMASIQLLPLLSYVFISTFTPGPANISSSSLGVMHGFRRTLSYQAGLAVGVFVMMLAGGLTSAALLRWLPALEPALRLVGAAYILYLAYGLLRASFAFTQRESQPLGFRHG